MSSKQAALGVKAGAKRSLRVGVIGAGVMGSNHARVLAGLPDTTLVGVSIHCRRIGREPRN
jgi:UDP-N-acetylglucosamine 3-dehydrogenase